jgi:hypothetical protein
VLIQYFIRTAGALFLKCPFGFGSAEARAIGLRLFGGLLPFDALLRPFEVYDVSHACPHNGMMWAYGKLGRRLTAQPRAPAYFSTMWNLLGVKKMRLLANFAPKLDPVLKSPVSESLLQKTLVPMPVARPAFTTAKKARIGPVVIT